jgi:hypothetical protein
MLKNDRRKKENQNSMTQARRKMGWMPLDKPESLLASEHGYPTRVLLYPIR